MSSENGPAKNALKNMRFGSVGENVPSNSPSLGALANTCRAAEPSGFATHTCGGVVRDSRCQAISPFWPGGVAAAGGARTVNRASATAPPVKRNDNVASLSRRRHTLAMASQGQPRTAGEPRATKLLLPIAHVTVLGGNAALVLFIAALHRC